MILSVPTSTLSEYGGSVKNISVPSLVLLVVGVDGSGGGVVGTVNGVSAHLPKHLQSSSVHSHCKCTAVPPTENG